MRFHPFLSSPFFSFPLPFPPGDGRAPPFQRENGEPTRGPSSPSSFPFFPSPSLFPSSLSPSAAVSEKRPEKHKKVEHSLTLFFFFFPISRFRRCWDFVPLNGESRVGLTGRNLAAPPFSPFLSFSFFFPLPCSDVTFFPEKRIGRSIRETLFPPFFFSLPSRSASFPFLEGKRADRSTDEARGFFFFFPFLFFFFLLPPFRFSLVGKADRRECSEDSDGCALIFFFFSFFPPPCLFLSPRRALF